MKGAFLNYFGSLWILGLLKVSIDLLWSLLPDRKKNETTKSHYNCRRFIPQSAGTKCYQQQAGNGPSRRHI